MHPSEKASVSRSRCSCACFCYELVLLAGKRCHWTAGLLRDLSAAAHLIQALLVQLLCSQDEVLVGLLNMLALLQALACRCMPLCIALPDGLAGCVMLGLLQVHSPLVLSLQHLNQSIELNCTPVSACSTCTVAASAASLLCQSWKCSEHCP